LWGFDSLATTGFLSQKGLSVIIAVAIIGNPYKQNKLQWGNHVAIS